MRLLLSLLTASILLTQGLFANADPVQLQQAKAAVPTISIRVLTSSSCPQKSIWAKGKLVEQTGDDTYFFEDRSGQMILFLPTDELMALALAPGMEVLVFGKVDISPVHPSKNELYAEKILLPPADK